MGAQAAEAERRVREQRALIERKVQDLEQRVGADFSRAGDRVQHHFTHLPDMVPGGSMLMGQAEEHPYTTVASSFGLGVALGLLTGGGRDEPERSNGHSRRSRDDGGMFGMAGGLLSGLGMTGVSALRPYLQDAAKQMVAGFAQGQRSEPESTRSHNGSGPAR